MHSCCAGDEEVGRGDEARRVQVRVRLVHLDGGGGGGGGHGDDGGGHDKKFHLHKNISPIFFPPEISKSSTLMLPIRNTTNTNVDEKMDNKSFDSFQ